MNLCSSFLSLQQMNAADSDRSVLTRAGSPTPKRKQQAAAAANPTSDAATAPMIPF
jgi:hypothetical protein